MGLLLGSAVAERPIAESHIQEFRQWMSTRAKAASRQSEPLTSMQALGAALYSDPNLSINRNQSCATCHSLSPATDAATGGPLPTAGFVDPLNIIPGLFVSSGSVPGQTGTLNAPSVGYAAFSPSFRWNKATGRFEGGLFWNGRAATLQQQASLPMLNPVEMGMPSPWAVVTRLKENAAYRETFKDLFKVDLDSIPSGENAPADANAPASVRVALAAATRAIAEFERSRVFNRFTSKFDFYLAGLTDLAPQEKAGLALFVGKAGCATCHTAEPTLTATGEPIPPLFTDFSYENIGTPPNPFIPGRPPADPGLGGRPQIKKRANALRELGKHKVSSLRNIAITPPYAHNGVFPTLESIMHFYNTRDSLGQLASGDAGFGVTGWPAPEYADTMNRDHEIGAMHLSEEEEAAVVAFMRTLTDDFPLTAADPNIPPGTPTPFPAAVPEVGPLKSFGSKTERAPKRASPKRNRASS